MDELAIYDQAFEAYGESPKAMHWIDYESQAIRFKHLVEDLEIEGRTILDAGCGMGDLLPYLYARADRFVYLGMDVNPRFIEVAKKRYAGHKFKVGDPFFGRLRERFDVVLSSGVMNQNIPDWFSVRREMIKSLFAKTDEVLAFNMAGSFKPLPADSKIAYANAGEIYDYCLTLTDKADLKVGYHPYDFTVIMRRR